MMDIVERIQAGTNASQPDVDSGKANLAEADLQRFKMLRLKCSSFIHSVENDHGLDQTQRRFGTEVVLTLMSWKVLYPKYVTLLRGNHEIRSVNESYGFKDEVAHKYGDDKIFSKFNNVFCKLPIAALIQQKVFVVHGGLPRAENGMVSIDSLRKLTVDVEPRERSILSDLLWSDPQDEYGVGMSPRNVGILFGPDVTQRFLQANNLDLIVRSHELCADGYRIQEGGKVVTIFSAPNYCGRCGNLAAYAKFDSNLKMTIRQFPATQRPPSPVKGQTPRAPAGAIDRTNSLTRYMD